MNKTVCRKILPEKMFVNPPPYKKKCSRHLGVSPGQGDFVVFLGKMLYPRSGEGGGGGGGGGFLVDQLTSEILQNVRMPRENDRCKRFIVPAVP